MNYKIVKASPARPKRGYRKSKHVLIHKDFILRMHGYGMSQKDILHALEFERDFHLKDHSLKRYLDEWGVSHKSLTEKRKLHIRNTILERRDQGKNLHRVTLGRSGRVLSEKEVRDVLNNFRRITLVSKASSPGDIILSTPSPATALDDDGYSQRVESKIAPKYPKYTDQVADSSQRLIFGMEEAKMNDDAEAPQSLPTDKSNLPPSTNMDVDTGVLGNVETPESESSTFGKLSRDSPSNEAFIDASLEKRPVHNPSLEAPQSPCRVSVSGPAGREPIIPEPDSLDKGESLAVTLENLCEDLTQSIKSMILQPVNQPVDTRQTCSPEEFWKIVSLRFIADFNWAVDEMENTARTFRDRQKMNSSSGGSKHSQGSPNDGLISPFMLLSDDWDFWAPKDPNIVEWAVRGDWPEFFERHGLSVREGFKNDILVAFYKILMHLWQTLGPDEATLAARSEGYFFHPIDQLRFRALVIHIPYLLSESSGISLTHRVVYEALVYFQDFARKFQHTRELQLGLISDTLLELTEFLFSMHSAFQLTLYRSSGAIINRIEMYAERNELHMVPRLIQRARGILIPSHFAHEMEKISGIQMAVRLQLLLVRMSRLEDAKTLYYYIKHNMHQSRGRGYGSKDSRYLAAAAGIISIHRELGQHHEVKEYGDILYENLATLSADDFKEMMRSPVAVEEWMVFYSNRAVANVEGSDSLSAVRVIQTMLHRLSYADPAVVRPFNKRVFDVVTWVLTERGLVHYTEPILERLVKGFQDERIPEDHPLYQKILFAAGSATFQLYLQDDEWSVSRFLGA
ncbi:hypothetical protein H072_228 [Dactylellina haptotyla CBS 200.50]|uniref:Clr5 domain-containing protein n=1 Tax=Dactylellina haptotyla (strain CBS 200.50) TaxID=1284197 RepID=S8AXS0_DACHA|nr:hypothetical protein H072_228 [Dactylellina haptotyla CBS 200.50]